MKTKMIANLFARYKKSLLSFLCAVVALATIWNLILPAVTIPAQASCGYQEHVHDESCYEDMLICEKEENHIHSENCYDEEGNLICTQEENHVHDASCYSQVLKCSQEEHVHSLQCYANLQADLESAADWEKTLPGQTRGNLRENLVQCAASQLNYTESESNFIVDSNGFIQNYSRYGAWNNDPYGDWGIDFVKFIFYYSGISSQLTPEQKILYLRSQAAAPDNLQQWMQELNQAGAAVPMDQARAGDLVLVPCSQNQEVQAKDSTALSELVASTQIRAGFITGFDYDQKKLICIMADWDKKVSQQSFSMTNAQIQVVSLPIAAENTGQEPAEETSSVSESPEDLTATDGQEDSGDNDLEEETDSSEEPEVFEEDLSPAEDPAAETPPEETGLSDESAQNTIEEEPVQNPEPDDEQTETEESETADEDHQLIQMTAAASDGAVITASYEKGVLPEEVQLSAKHIEENTAAYLDLENRIRDQIRDEIDENTAISLSAYDLSFLVNEESTGEKTKIQPEGMVQITIHLPGSVSSSEYTQNRLFHYSEEGQLTDLTDEDSTRFGQEESETLTTITFASEGFSIFVNASYTYSGIDGWTDIYSAQDLFNQLDSTGAGQTRYLRLRNSLWNNNGNGNTTYTVKQGKVVLDMNGFCIERQGSESAYQGVFVVKNNAQLVLTNSKNISESPGGSSGSYSEADNNTYITYTGVNSASPMDANCQVKTVRNVSIVRSKTGTAIYVESGGQLVLEKVAVMSSSDAKAVISNKPAISLASGSSCTMTNAYVVFSYGGISSNGAAIKMDGGAIADNAMAVSQDGVKGAGIAATGGSIELDQGAEITNNSLSSWISRGGGIYASDCTLTLNSCYVGFNTAGNYASGAYAAGGGIAAIGGSKVTLNNGCYITGNTSGSIGGGMWCGDPGGAVLYVRGAVFCWNTAVNNEGGGLALAYKSASVGIIESGTFYQNKTVTPEQWGGGGIFCAEGSYLYFPNGASVYDNHADGYGGGLASCSTGKIVIDNKLGIFNNTTGRADGSHATSGSSSDKSADKIYVQTDKVFVERGANDVFGTSNTEISALLPDGSGANWWGSMDGSPISNVNSGQLIADYLLGVTCEASSAVKEANSHMPVLIYENSSTVHGGGVLINGILLSSNPSVLFFGDSITLTASKQLVGANGSKKDLSSYAGKFTFNVTDEKGTVVSVGTMTETGEIQFDRRLIFMPESEQDPTKSITFYIEENSTGITDIIADQTKYKIVLTIEKHTDTIIDQDALVNGAHISVTEYRFKISGASVYKISPDGSETLVASDFTQNAESLDYAPSLTLTKNETSFTNVQSDTIHITAQKNWEDGEENHWNDRINITLVQTNTATGEVNEYKAVLSSFTDPAWFWDFGSFPTKDGSGEYTYAIQENTALPGYISVITSSVSAAAGSSNDVWIPVMDEPLQNGMEYLIVAENANTALANNYHNNYNEQNITSSSKISLNLNETNTVNGITYGKVYKDSPDLTYALWTCNTSFSFTGYTSNAFYNQASGAYLRVENGKPNGLMFTNASNLSSYGGNFWKSGWDLYGKSKNGENSLILYSEGTTSFSSSLYYCTNKNQGSQYPVRLYKKASAAGAAGGVSENFVITNRIAQNVEYKVSLKKVDEEDQGMVLQNAVFTLSLHENGKDPLSFSKENIGYVYAEDTSDSITTTHLVSDRYGAIVIQGLPEGTYYLTEIQAPNGYTALKAPIKITINPNTVDWNTLTYALEVQNTKKILSLPETGLTSFGKWTLMQAGGLLMGISTAGVMWDHRRRKRKQKE